MALAAFAALALVALAVTNASAGNRTGTEVAVGAAGSGVIQLPAIGACARVEVTASVTAERSTSSSKVAYTDIVVGARAVAADIFELAGQTCTDTPKRVRQLDLYEQWHADPCPAPTWDEPGEVGAVGEVSTTLLPAECVVTPFAAGSTYRAGNSGGSPPIPLDDVVRRGEDRDEPACHIVRVAVTAFDESGSETSWGDIDLCLG
jgi:hypothetical protein